MERKIYNSVVAEYSVKDFKVTLRHLGDENRKFLEVWRAYRLLIKYLTLVPMNITPLPYYQSPGSITSPLENISRKQ